jgi:hypothetical protein
MSASTTRPGRAGRAFLLAVLALVLSAVAGAVRARTGDGLSGAWWIGCYPVARGGEAATIVFGSPFTLESAAPKAALRMRANGRYAVLLDGAAVGIGETAGLVEQSLPGPLAAGEHEILVLVTHPEGASALRLALLCEGREKREVVTGPGWRVDDDMKRMKTGFGGLRYPATLWARPPLSVFSVSSSTRSVRDSAGVSTAPSSSRIPSRAATE